VRQDGSFDHAIMKPKLLSYWSDQSMTTEFWVPVPWMKLVLPPYMK
jgi:hypothetical protein